MVNKKITPPKLKLNDGHEMPVLGLGTLLGIDGTTMVKCQEGELAKLVELAIDAGYRHFDTAANYQTEGEVGNGVRNKIAEGTIKREDIFITTKLWNDQHAHHEVVPALKESLKKLGLDYVDLYLIHCPMAFSADGDVLDIDYLDTWKGMEETKKLGLAKSIGLSNFNEQQIERVFANVNIKPAVLQVEVNLNLAQKSLLSLARSKGMAVTAFAPFGALLPSRAMADSPPPRVDDSALVAIANRHGKTTAQVILRHLLDRDLIVIPKSVSPERIIQNLDVFDFQLSEEETGILEAFNCDYRFGKVSFWQHHPHYPFERMESPESSVPNSNVEQF